MAQGDVDAQIVESPITVSKINTAAGAAIAATSSSAILSMTSFNQGRSIAVLAKEE